MSVENTKASVEGIVVSADTLRAFSTEILRALGARARDAERVADHMVGSNLAGHDSHGVLLLPAYAHMIGQGEIRADAELELVSDRGAVIVIDGHYGFGQSIGRAAVELGIERGHEYGIACILGRNANHLGRIGEHTAAVAEAGLAAILLVNCQGSAPQQFLAPYGGAERRLTNNPVSVAVPGVEHPVLLDMALSVIAGAKVNLALARGLQLPEGCLLDASGEPSTDPRDYFTGGTLQPVGGHKGYGLIILTDILAGILSGGGACREDGPAQFSNAFMLITIDVEALAERERYEEELKALIDYVKSSRRLPGFDEILLPGDFEARNGAVRQSTGIFVENETWNALNALAADLGVEPCTAAP
jgi:uncharacterized oxidoreductase